MSNLGNKDIMAKNLQYYMDRSGIDRNKLCEDLDLKYTTISDWINAKTYPRIDKIEMLANYFNITKADLVEDKAGEPSDTLNFKPRVHPGVRIPILGNIVAGIPSLAIEEYDDWEEISEAMASQGEHFALRVVGASMEPELYEGDIVIIRKQSDVSDGDIAVVLINGDEATLKRVYHQRDGVRIIADNKRVFPDKFYSNKEIEERPVKVLGKAVEVRRGL